MLPSVGYYLSFFAMIADTCLKIDVNACEEHPQICGSQVVPGKEIFVETVHPPLSPLTPHGMYRSKQYYRTSTGGVIGCVDIMIPYVK